ncbi:MAG: DUF4097 family beta strand repeat-containing protein [Terriglobia bacterium]
MTKKRFANRSILLAALFVAAVPASLWCAGPAQESSTFYTTRTPRITLTNITGTVVVRGWAKPRVRAVSVMASPHVEIDKEQVPPQGEAEKIQLVTHILDRSVEGPGSRVDYTLDVPVGASVEIRNPQGLVRIDNLTGDTWVQSVGGNIFISGAAGEVNASSFGGEIEIDRSSGAIQASTVTGNLKFVSPSSTEIHGNTTSGNIAYEGDLVPSGNYVMRTYNGGISFLIPRSSSFELNARCGHCKVDNQLKLSRSNRHSTVPSFENSLFGIHNLGTATLKLTSFKGSIRITPQPEAPQQ